MIRHPFDAPPAEGQVIAVAAGILWLRLPLPMAMPTANFAAAGTRKEAANIRLGQAADDDDRTYATVASALGISVTQENPGVMAPADPDRVADLVELGAARCGVGHQGFDREAAGDEALHHEAVRRLHVGLERQDEVALQALAHEAPDVELTQAVEEIMRPVHWVPESKYWW